VLDLIAPNLFQRLFDERVPVTHADVGSRVDVAACEGRFERASLFFGDASKRRASADLLVITSRFLVALRRDQPRQRFLKRSPWKANDVGVSKEIEEKRANFFEGLAYTFNLQKKFDFKALSASKSCDQLGQLNEYMSKLTTTLNAGASVQPATADQIKKQLAGIVDFVTKAKVAWKCKF